MKNTLFKFITSPLVVTLTVLSLSFSAFAAKEDKKEYPFGKNAQGQWDMLQEWPSGDPSLEVSQTYDYVDPNTKEVTNNIRTFVFYGATEQEVKTLKEAHEAFEALVDQYEADREKIWDATKVISKETRKLILDFVGRGYASMNEAVSANALPDDAKAWFSDRLLSNQGRLLMYILREHGQDDVDSKLGERINDIRNKLDIVKKTDGTFKDKLFKRVALHGQLMGIRVLVLGRELGLNLRRNVQWERDQNGKVNWGPMMDRRREVLTRDSLSLLRNYVLEVYNKLDYRSEVSKFSFNALDKILERAVIVRAEREFGQSTLFWSLVATTVYFTIQAPVEYTLVVPERGSALASGLINFVPLSLYTLRTWLTRGVRVLKDVEKTYEIVMNPEQYGKPGVTEAGREDKARQEQETQPVKKKKAVSCKKASGG